MSSLISFPDFSDFNVVLSLRSLTAGGSKRQSYSMMGWGGRGRNSRVFGLWVLFFFSLFLFPALIQLICLAVHFVRLGWEVT